MAVVQTVLGVHDHTVSIQYLVVLVSFGESVTEKSVFLHVLFALSVVPGTTVSTLKLDARICNALLTFHTASVTVIVDGIYVASDNVLYVRVLFHTCALVGE